jgi:hypothetical protein
MKKWLAYCIEYAAAHKLSCSIIVYVEAIIRLNHFQGEVFLSVNN